MRRFNQQDAERNGDSEVMARIAQYEMAYRMQMAVLELADFSEENPKILDSYGPNVRKPGTIGKTDDVSYNLVDSFGKVMQGDPGKYVHGAVHIHDLHATIIRLVGVDHERLTYRYQGRDFRLTDIHGHVVNDLLA